MSPALSGLHRAPGLDMSLFVEMLNRVVDSDEPQVRHGTRLVG